MGRTEEIHTKVVWTVADLVCITGWSKKTIYNKISLRQIPCYKPDGKTVFFKPSEIMDYLFRNRQATNAELVVIANEKY